MDNKVVKQLSTIKNHITSLHSVEAGKNVLKIWFKELCILFTDFILLLKDYHKTIDKNGNNKGTILLNLHQSISILSLLINLFVRESELEQPLPEIRFFCKSQLMICLRGIEYAISGKLHSDTTKSNFFNLMDEAFEKIKSLDFMEIGENRKNLEKLNDVIEELLGHCMSVVQVSLEDDKKKIRGSSLSLLESLGNLAIELKKPDFNKAFLDLYLETGTRKLCLLEHKVNTAVVKLCIRIFSEYTRPLESIQDFCFDKSNRLKKDELDDLIVEFDLHVDRLLVVGLFVSSGSNCFNEEGKIKSCMGIIEALETELIPAFTSVLSSPNLTNTHLALILKNYWINQADAMRKLIYGRLHPHLFCEVIIEENTRLIEEMKKYYEEHAELSKDHFERLMKHSKVVVDFMAVVMQEHEEDGKMEEIQKALKEFKSVLHEVQSAYEILENNEINFARIIKRCKIYLTTLNSLKNCFKDTASEQKSEDGESKQKISETFIMNLDDFINRERETAKNRSVLFKTNSFNNTSEHQEYSTQTTYININSKTFIKCNKNAKLGMLDILKEMNNLTQLLTDK